MAVRVLLMLAALAVLYSCGQVSSPAEKHEKKGGEEEAQSKTAGTPTPEQEEETTTAGAGTTPSAEQQKEVTATGDQKNIKASNSKCLGKYRRFGSVDYSPDGRKIVFTSHYDYDAGYASATATAAPGTSPNEADDEICVVNADGTGMVRLTDDSEDETVAIWSPDGTKIAFVRSSAPDDADIFVMNADGSNETKVLDSSYLYELSWSPDGQEIAFESNERIYIMHADGSGTPRTLLSDPAWSGAVRPAWSPDGKKIAFAAFRRNNRARDIYVVQVGDTDQWRQLAAGGIDPTWSPDGTEIAFTRHEVDLSGPDTMMVYKVNTDGTKEVRLVDGWAPTWLPDGKHIAYLAGRNLYVVNADGSNPTLVIADTVK